MAMALAQQSCEQLAGVGPKLNEKLLRCGIHSLADLIFHLPSRYADETCITPIGRLSHASHVVIEGEVIAAGKTAGKRPSFIATLSDGSGQLNLRFFYYLPGHEKKLREGMTFRAIGEARRLGPHVEMVHPEYFDLADATPPPPLATTLTPIYPTTEGLSQKVLRKLIQQTLQLMTTGMQLNELIPSALCQRFGLGELRDALYFVHQPPAACPLESLSQGLHPQQRRLAFEELLAQQLSLLRSKQSLQQQRAIPLPAEDSLYNRLCEQLPYQLTSAQQRVVTEIREDLAKPQPMLRLLQGDVGSGKTVVAALAATQAIAAGFQVALMAPTEILAEQHLLQFQRWFDPLGVNLVWLTGKQATSARQHALEILASDTPCIAIGTHALFQREVCFGRLNLVIIDEQHRFGVGQRMALRDKGDSDHVSHQLIMTATPIPRTLSMAAYADLDQSIIDELPPGRKPITTIVVAESKRDAVIAGIRQRVSQGRQIYWVCTLIEDSPELSCQAAEETFQHLRETLADMTVGLVHGRMSAEQKAGVMAAFVAGDIDVLVATTVIEVGVNVPNASLMVIENAERLGLSQLHQLRGRVGRGEYESHCILMYKPPLSRQARSRLHIMRQTQDGFRIAEEDLALRGPGEFLGTRQSGLMQMRVADLTRDSDLLNQVKACGQAILSQYPTHIDPLIKRWLGQAIQYAAV